MATPNPWTIAGIPAHETDLVPPDLTILETFTETGETCHRWQCGGRIVTGRIMRWCPRCKWTGYAKGH